jgi:hypothetical protein
VAAQAATALQVEDQAQVAEEVDLTALALVAQAATAAALAQGAAEERLEQIALAILALAEMVLRVTRSSSLTNYETYCSHRRNHDSQCFFGT